MPRVQSSEGSQTRILPRAGTRHKAQPAVASSTRWQSGCDCGDPRSISGVPPTPRAARRIPLPPLFYALWHCSANYRLQMSGVRCQIRSSQGHEADPSPEPALLLQGACSGHARPGGGRYSPAPPKSDVRRQCQGPCRNVKAAHDSLHPAGTAAHDSGECWVGLGAGPGPGPGPGPGHGGTSAGSWCVKESLRLSRLRVVGEEIRGIATNPTRKSTDLFCESVRNWCGCPANARRHRRPPIPAELGLGGANKDGPCRAWRTQCHGPWAGNESVREGRAGNAYGRQWLIAQITAVVW
jgi:hypothetical protein